MSEGSEVPQPSVTERISAVTGSLRENPHLVGDNVARGIGGFVGATLASAPPEAPWYLIAAGGVIGAIGLGEFKKGNREDGIISEANRLSDPGPVEVGTRMKVKDLVNAWKTGEVQDLNRRMYHKDNPTGKADYVEGEEK